jgi:hypothetical protein
MTETRLSPIAAATQPPLNKQPETKKKLQIRTDFSALCLKNPA